MASIRRPHSPAKQQHLLRHHPFAAAAAASSPPSSPLRHSSSSSAAASSSSPTRYYYLSHLNPASHHHPPASSLSWWWRRPLLRFAAFFLLGSFLGLLHFLSVLSSLPHPNLPLPLPHHHAAAAISIPDQIVGGGGGDGGGGGEEKLLIVVTATHGRAAQGYYLERLGQTLRLVGPPVLWVVVEMGRPTQETAELLRRSGVMYRHVACDRANSSLGDSDRPRQINAALELVEIHRLDGILFFADEENVYSLRLFSRLRRIKRFGAWPVPVLSESRNDAMLEGPVCRGGKVVGWHTNDDSNKLRRFHVDMSGFAFNSTMLWDTKLRSHLAWNSIRHPDIVEEGFQETTFVEQLVEDESQMEGVPSDCSEIMNWHVQFETENLAYPRGWRVPRNLDVIIPLK